MGEGVVRVVLEAPPLVVAWVKVQPRLPPAPNLTAGGFFFLLFYITHYLCIDAFYIYWHTFVH